MIKMNKTEKKLMKKEHKKKLKENKEYQLCRKERIHYYIVRIGLIISLFIGGLAILFIVIYIEFMFFLVIMEGILVCIIVFSFKEHGKIIDKWSKLISKQNL